MELEHPNSVIMIIGDFNRQPLKLPNYQQVVTKPTRNCKILDECYVNAKNSYSYCRQLATLGNADHQIIHLLPTYSHKAKQKPIYVSRRIYSDKNI